MKGAPKLHRVRSQRISSFLKFSSQNCTQETSYVITGSWSRIQSYIKGAQFRDGKVTNSLGQKSPGLLPLTIILASTFHSRKKLKLTTQNHFIQILFKCFKSGRFARLYFLQNAFNSMYSWQKLDYVQIPHSVGLKYRTCVLI